MDILAKIYLIIEKVPYLKKLGPRKVLQILGAAVLIIVLLIVLVPKPARTDLKGLTSTVKKGDFVVNLIESGEIEAEKQIFVNAPSIYGASLQIIDLVPEGTKVKKGDFLMQFDASDLESQKTLRIERLASLKADLAKMESQHKLTISNFENSLKLSQYSYEQAKLNLKIRQYESESSKEEARLQLKQAEIDLERSKKQLESQKIINRSQIIKIKSSIKQAKNLLRTTEESIKKCTVISPENGMVIYQEVGSWKSRERLKVGYSARRGEPLLVIPDMSSMVVKFFVNEIDRLKVKQGQKIAAHLEAYPDVPFTGTITSVSQLAQPVDYNSNLKEFVVYAKLDTVMPILKPGMSVQVSVILKNYSDVLYAAVGAVFEYKGQNVVFPFKKRKPFVVYLGDRNDGFIILKRGVNPGEKLLLEDPNSKTSILGYAEEEKRIERVKSVMSGSFNVFKKLGILYKYSSETSKKDSLKSTPKLPSFLKKRLEKGKGLENSKGVESKVDEPAKRNRKKSLDVTTKMMKKMNKKSSNRK